MSEQPGLLRRLDRTGAPLLVGRLIMGLMFLWMGLAKTGVTKAIVDKAGARHNPRVESLVERELLDLSDPFNFLKLIREYKLVPEAAFVPLNLVAVVLPWVEVLCGLLLILGVAVRGSALILLIMLIVFTTAIIIRAVGIHQAEGTPFCEISFECGCGAGKAYFCHKIPENLGLCLLSLLALLSRSKRFCLRADLVRA